MNEYIEREKAQDGLDNIDWYHVNDKGQLLPGGRTGIETYVPFKAVEEMLKSIPAADVRPVVKSKWADNHVSFYRGCPECGAFVRANLDEVFLLDFPSAVGKLNYCPNCGADMREES